MVIILVVDVRSRAWGHGDHLDGLGVIVIVFIVEAGNQAWGHGDHLDRGCLESSLGSW